MTLAGTTGEVIAAAAGSNYDKYAYRPPTDAVAILTRALTGPTSLGQAEYLAPGVARNLAEDGYEIVQVTPP